MTTDPRPDSSSAHHDAQVAAVLNVLRLAVGETIGSSGLAGQHKADPRLREVAKRCVHAVRAPGALPKAASDHEINGVCIVDGCEQHGSDAQARARAENARDALARRLDAACQEIDDAHAALHHAGYPRQSGERLADTIGRAFPANPTAVTEGEEVNPCIQDARGRCSAPGHTHRKKPRFQLDPRTNRRTRHLRSGGTVWVHPGDPAPIELDLYGETGVAFGSDDEVCDFVDTLTAAIALPPLDPPPPAGPVVVTATAPAPDGWFDDGRPSWRIHDESGDHDDGREGETHTVQVDPEGQVTFDGQPVVLGEQVGAAIIAAARWTGGGTS